MLIEEFSFGNFRSFKDIQTLRMSAAKIKSKNKQLDIDNILTVSDKTKLLKSKIIYGANASGKSNVINALNYFKTIVCFSLKSDSVLSLLQSYIFSTETQDKPTFYQLIFFIDKKKYRYGFEASKEKIHSEWLYLTDNIRETPIFIRDEQAIIDISKKHLDKGYEIAQMKNKLFTEKVLFLSLIVTFGDALAEKLIEAIQSICVFSNEDQKFYDGFVNEQLKEEARRESIVSLLKHADTGIDDLFVQNLKIKDQDEDIRISTHSVYNENLEKTENTIRCIFDHSESDGTKQMLYLGAIMLDALKQGHPVIVDEFGSQLHPLLTKHLFSLFNRQANNQSQIIAATHTADLMSSNLLRKDQIDFVEKDKYGRSYLYTLVEMKGIRNTASFVADYFKGKYGGIPFLGNWDELISICNDTKNEENEPE